ncbi:hypothetical protein U3516DRAFT_852148 [Neocallimastix sp. 'constans']
MVMPSTYSKTNWIISSTSPVIIDKTSQKSLNAINSTLFSTVLILKDQSSKIQFAINTFDTNSIYKKKKKLSNKAVGLFNKIKGVSVNVLSAKIAKEPNFSNEKEVFPTSLTSIYTNSLLRNNFFINKLFGIKDLYNYIDEEASTVNRYLYNIYPVLFLFTPESIPLIYIKLWPSISYIKNNKRGNEKSKFLNSPECTKILDRKDLNHNQKSDIITQLFFSSRSSQSFDIIEAKRREKEREIQNKKLETGTMDAYNLWKRVKQDLEEGGNWKAATQEFEIENKINEKDQEN